MIKLSNPIVPAKMQKKSLQRRQNIDESRLVIGALLTDKREHTKNFVRIVGSA